MSLLSALKPKPMTNKGAYSASTTYYVNDVVTYNGATYICILAGTLNVVPTTTANWTVIMPAVTTAVTGTGTNPANFTLTASNNVVTLNKL